MKVLQVLPSLNSGGVERGTLDFARHLLTKGHQSLVMSSGGRMVAELEREGSTHVTFAVHAKSPLSLLRVRALRRQLIALAPDVIHVRSRVPAWMVWLALKPLPPTQRPLLVSTFHGLYSVSRYSAIMGEGDQVIAISDCVHNYILHNYPQVEPKRIHVIHRGVDVGQFPPQMQPDNDWLARLHADYPHTRDQTLLLMPARLSAWKGQRDFIRLIGQLIHAGRPCHGLIVGEPTPGKDHYLAELRQLVSELKLESHISFLGHRSDMAQLYAAATLVFNLSEKPEPFGRTVIEALATGTAVIAWDSGGPAESLRIGFDCGLIPPGDNAALLTCVQRLLDTPPAEITLPPQFTLTAQAEATLALYTQGLQQLGRTL
ncbi:MAG: glycosyltransferase family 4 protein [Parahaliea sp.]